MTHETTPDAEPVVRPRTLQHPIRRRVKKYGKRLTRAVARLQSRQSLVPDRPFISNDYFPFLTEYEERWEEIAREAREIVKFREDIPGFQDLSPDQYRIATGKNWKTFVLFGFGEKLQKNCRHATVTAEILSRTPNIQIAWFSILAPGYHIPAHTGVTKGIVRAHLGLLIPRDHEKCRIRVGDETRSWREGKVFVLDDTYDHEVWNDTDEERVILLFDFDRPMRFWGRLINRILLSGLKLTAFYKEPRRNAADYEARFEAATRRADETLEKLGERS